MQSLLAIQNVAKTNQFLKLSPNFEANVFSRFWSLFFVKILKLKLKVAVLLRCCSYAFAMLLLCCCYAVALLCCCCALAVLLLWCCYDVVMMFQCNCLLQNQTKLEFAPNMSQMWHGIVKLVTVYHFAKAEGNLCESILTKRCLTFWEIFVGMMTNTFCRRLYKDHFILCRRERAPAQRNRSQSI